MRGKGGFEHVSSRLDGDFEGIDRELVRLARGGSALRLRLGEVLAEMVRLRAHEDLGFSSIDAYVAERCGVAPRWAADARALARHCEALPRLRAALMAGEVGWSMAEVVGRKAMPQSEAFVVGLAKTAKVDRMKKLLAAGGEVSRPEAPDSTAGHDEAVPDDEAVGDVEADPDDERVRVRRLVAREAAEVFGELQRLVACHAGTDSPEAVMEAILAEGLTGLVEHADDEPAARLPRRRRELAEPEPPSMQPPELTFDFGPLPDDARGLDCEAVRLSREITRRDLTIGELMLELRDCGGWRALGFASEAQYCRERLGMSPSSVKARKWLAEHAARFPELWQALEEGRLGFEAGRLIARVATQDSVAAWVAHARRRTFKHLRQDVDEAEQASRISGEVPSGPPSQISGGVETVPEAADDPTAVPPRKMGRVELTFPMSRRLVQLFLVVEAAWQRAGRPYGDLFRFLAVEFLQTWEHDLEPDVAYAEVYWRDGWQCASPTCSRRDGTPHHLVFRSMGGGDEMENVVTLCSWCHLEGIHHVGSIRAEGPASAMVWKTPVLEVHGREVVWRAE